MFSIIIISIITGPVKKCGPLKIIHKKWKVNRKNPDTPVKKRKIWQILIPEFINHVFYNLTGPVKKCGPLKIIHEKWKVNRKNPDTPVKNRKIWQILIPEFINHVFYNNNFYNNRPSEKVWSPQDHSQEMEGESQEPRHTREKKKNLTDSYPWIYKSCFLQFDRPSEKVWSPQDYSREMEGES